MSKSSVNKNKLNSIVSVFDFGAVGDGVADDTAAINAAISAAGARDLFFPAGIYKITSTLTQLPGQAWIGDGGQRSTILSKAFNGDLVIPGTLGTISDLTIEGNGATYSGRGIYVSNGVSIRIERVRVNETAGVCLEFADMVGVGSHISDFEGRTTNLTVVPAIKISDTTGPAPKFFEGIWLPGGLFDFSGGGDGSSINNFYIRAFVMSAPNYPSYTAASRLFKASNGRIANLTDTSTISGADNLFTNIAFAGYTNLEKAQGNKLEACTFGLGCTEDPVTAIYNSWTDQRKSFATVWSQSSGVQPSIGDGTLEMSFQRNGYVCSVFLRLVIGSTTTLGNAATAWRFSLPFRSHASFTQRGFVAYVYDPSGAGSAQDRIINGVIGTDESTINFNSQNQSVRSTFPISWAVGARIEMSFTYMVK